MAIYNINGVIVTDDVVTDTTLTQSGVPADAKKVGDELHDIQAQLNNGDERRY